MALFLSRDSCLSRDQHPVVAAGRWRAEKTSIQAGEQPRLGVIERVASQCVDRADHRSELKGEVAEDWGRKRRHGSRLLL